MPQCEHGLYHMHHLVQIRPSGRNVEQFLLQAANERFDAFNQLDLSGKLIQWNGYGAVSERRGAISSDDDVEKSSAEQHENHGEEQEERKPGQLEAK